MRLTTTPQGQGHRTVVAQVAADALGLDAGGQSTCRRRPTPPSNPWTVSSGNYSSRFAAVGAGAVHVAATRLAERLRAIARRARSACAPAEVELAEGAARVRAVPERRVSLRRLAGAAHWDPARSRAGVEQGSR